MQDFWRIFNHFETHDQNIENAFAITDSSNVATLIRDQVLFALSLDDSSNISLLSLNTFMKCFICYVTF